MNKQEVKQVLLELIRDFHHYKYMTDKRLFGHKKITLYEFMQWLESIK